MNRQYIGARYVPKFFELNDGQWDSSYSYEALTIVQHGNDWFTSKVRVPIGVDITNTTYWALTGNYNGAIAGLDERVSELEKIHIDFVNVLDYGFDNTGTDDNSELVQDLPDGVWFFPAGLYLFSEKLVINKVRCIGYGATLKLTESSGTFIETYADSGNVILNSSNFFEGFIIDCDYKANIAIEHKSGRVCKFADLAIKNFNGTGIKCGAQIISNVHINQVYEHSVDIPSGTIGIDDKGDCMVTNCTIVDCEKGIKCGPGSSYVNVYTWLSQDYTYNGSIAYVIPENCDCQFNGCTVDTIQTGFDMTGSYTQIGVNGLCWMFNQNVVTDEQVSTPDSCLFKREAGNSSNRINCTNLSGVLRNYHLKMFSDNLVLTANVANSYAYAKVENICASGTSNLTNILNNLYHQTIDNQFTTGSGVTIEYNSTSYHGDMLDGTLVLKGDGNAWNGKQVTITGGLRNAERIPVYFSDNGYNFAGIGIMTISAAGTGTITADGSFTNMYCIIPIHLVMKLNSLI